LSLLNVSVLDAASLGMLRALGMAQDSGLSFFYRRHLMKHSHATTPPAKAAVPRAAAEPKAQAVATKTGDAKDEFVRQAAYYYYEARGRIGGNELDDWLRAEAEFERTMGSAQDAPSGTASH
jgi:Protein of unknown function (DUF2934)